MKKLALSVVLALVGALPAYAQLGDVDNSSFVITNQGTEYAVITVTFYDEAGIAIVPDPLHPHPYSHATCDEYGALPNPFTLDPDVPIVINMSSVCGLAAGRYSAVIRSTEPVAAVANMIGDEGGGAMFYNGSYSAFDAGAATIYFPSTQYEFYNWNSLISVQNTTPDLIAADLYILDEGGNQVAHEWKGIPAFASYHWDLETDGAALGLKAGLNGSARVECSGACVGTDNQTANGGFTQSYNTFLSGAQTLYAPALYTDYYTWGASLKVQNIGAGPTNITVEYFIAGAGSCVAPAENIAAGQSLYHYLPGDWAGWGCASATDKIIGAKITSDAEDVVGVVNAANPAGQAQTYGAFATGAGTVRLPITMNQWYGWDTAFVCQNLGSSTTTVTYLYSLGPNTGWAPGCHRDPEYPDCTFSLEPGEAKSVYQPNDLEETATDVFAVTVTSPGTVACIVNETNGSGQAAGTGDWSMSYNGFGQ